MSARVFNPLVMSEMRRMIGRSSSEGQVVSISRVRRDLFGPVNHEDAQTFVEKELAAIRQRESERWGFDFERETPMENSRFKWERVSPEENIPEAWAVRRLLGQKDTKTTTTTTPAEKSSTTTTQRVAVKSAQKQTQMTDYMRQRKRSLSLGDLTSARSKLSSDSGAPSGKRSKLAASATPHHHQHQ